MMQRLHLVLSGLIILPVLSMVVAIAMPAPHASAACRERVLGFPTWYRGLVEGDCSIKKVGKDGMKFEEFAIRIALNIAEFLLVLVGYAATIMLIVGGFQYITSRGESSNMANARTTITNAIIGLIISIFSVALVNFVSAVV